MKIRQMFREPIDKNDLLAVIRQALFMAIVGGLLTGAIHLLVDQIFHISLVWMFLFIYGLTLSRRIHEAYKTYHIIYTIIAIIAVFTAFYLLNVVYLSGYLYMIGLLNTNYINDILNPFGYFSFLNFLKPGFFTVVNIIDVFFFILVNIYVVRYLK